jgi:hypothetical protein
VTRTLFNRKGLAVLSKLRSRLTYANAVASIALFIALGGTSYAIATGSIGTREIKNNSVTGRDVRNSSLTGADVRNSRLTGADIRNDGLTGADVLESSLDKVPAAGAADTADTADSANTANTANTADSARTATTADRLAGEYFAVVNADGTLARATANVDVASELQAPPGRYYVTIDRDAGPCFYLAALAADHTGYVAAQPDPGAPANAVFVVTRDTTGSLADRAFTLHIRC